MINNNSITNTPNVNTVHLAPLLQQPNQTYSQRTRTVMFSTELSSIARNVEMTRQEALRQAILRTG